MFLKNKIKYLNPLIFFKKLVYIFQHPQSPKLNNFYTFIFNLFNKNKKNDDIFYAIYDLEYYPNTFNFVEFLVLCNNESKLRNKDYFILFLPMKKKSINLTTEYYKIVRETYRWRLYNLLFPLTYCSMKCVGYNYFHSRKLCFQFINDKETYPSTYSKNFNKPLDISYIYNNKNILKNGSISAPNSSLKIVNDWLLNQNIYEKFVTISIRDQKFDKIRNNNIGEWKLFSEYLKDQKFIPIIIPDTESNLNLKKIFKDCIICYEASLNVLFRIALNELAYTNLFVSHGPISLCSFNLNTSYIVMNYGPKEGSITDNVNAYKKSNDYYEGNYVFGVQNQIRSWKKDTLSNIIYEFEKLIF